MNKIIQEKWTVHNGPNILTLKGFKRCKSNMLRLSQVKLFNSLSEAKTHTATKYISDEHLEYVKVVVTFEEIRQ